MLSRSESAPRWNNLFLRKFIASRETMRIKGGEEFAMFAQNLPWFLPAWLVSASLLSTVTKRVNLDFVRMAQKRLRSHG